MVIRFLGLLVVVLLMGMSLTSCSVVDVGKEVIGLEKKQPKRLKMTFESSADLNPDKNGRPSPLSLRIYELNSDQAFLDSGFYDIYEDDADVLVGEYIKHDSLVFKPGETRDIELPISEDTLYLGFFAAYRDLDRAQWRFVLPVNKRLFRRTLKLRVDLGEYAMKQR